MSMTSRCCIKKGCWEVRPRSRSRCRRKGPRKERTSLLEDRGSLCSNNSTPHDGRLLQHKQQFYMTEEELKRLNFYSKYSRAHNKQGIQSLYSLISGAKSASILQIQIASQSRVKQRSLRKASASPKKLKKPASAKPVYTEPSQPVQEQFILTEQLTSKLQQLKKLQDQFHQQMAEKQLEARKRKEEVQELRRSKQNQHPISVVEEKQTSSPRKSSSQLILKKSVSRENAVQRVIEEDDLDFQDYYMDCPEIPISSAYDHTNERQKIKDMLQIQRMKQQEVQSVDEECEKASSIVIGRLDMANRALHEQEHSPESEAYEGTLENSFPTKNLAKHQSQPEATPQRLPRQSIQVEDSSEQIDSSQCEPMEIGKELSRWQLSKNGPPKQVESMQNIPEDPLQFHHTRIPSNDPLPDVASSQSQVLSDHDHNNLELPLHPSGNVPPRPFTNRTATDEGSQFRDEIADQVDPIQKKSEVLHKGEGQQRPIYYSQTANQHISMGRQVQSIPSSPDCSPMQSFNEITNRQKQLEQRKSSFKRLMAQNRANLVPRMAISTILNEHINEALVDFKVSSQAVSLGPSPQLKESMVQAQESPSSSKKKINFKRRIVEKEKDKSYSRDGKPTFERDPAKIQKNQKLLAGFFQDN